MATKKTTSDRPLTRQDMLDSLLDFGRPKRLEIMADTTMEAGARRVIGSYIEEVEWAEQDALTLLTRIRGMR